MEQKKRGRKPKNVEDHVSENVIEKKKRGRKKKYEIENFEKILNRDSPNNFDHKIVYSDDEEHLEQKSVKQISFGSLNIIVSKKTQETIDDYRNVLKSKCVINEDEYSSDSSTEEENVKDYHQEDKYVPGNITDPDISLKKIRVTKCIKDKQSFEEWPESTDICCWWCCHQFKGSPCTLPTSYDSLRKRFKFVGIFCSWNCTKAYNNDRNDCVKYQRSEYITLIVQQLHGLPRALGIKASPPRQTLKMFGGYLDIDEFRSSHSDVSGYHINDLNYTFIYPEVTEIRNVKVKKQNGTLKLSRNN
jgi:hypothetical protein